MYISKTKIIIVSTLSFGSQVVYRTNKDNIINIILIKKKPTYGDPKGWHHNQVKFTQHVGVFPLLVCFLFASN